MLLASIAEVRDVLGFDDMTDINAAISSGLMAAEPYLEGQLGTTFKYGTQTDTFWARYAGYIDGDHVQTEFRLRYGFVQSFTLQAMVGRMSDWSTPGNVTDLSEIVEVDQDKGVVSNYQTRFTNNYVRFTYDHGFPPASNDPGEQSYDLTVVPKWLQEAAKAYCLIKIADRQELQQLNIKQDLPGLKAQVENTIAQKRRYTPVALLPL